MRTSKVTARLNILTLAFETEVIGAIGRGVIDDNVIFF